MRFVKRDQEFKSERCTLNIRTMEAWSYDWWQFVACLKGKVYFNAISYSMQTSKQQTIVKDLLNALGVKYTTVYVKCGLQNIPGEVERLQYEIRELKDKIANPRSRPETNKYRKQWIKRLERDVKQLKTLARLKPTVYKGKVNLDNIPKPEPMPQWKKERMKQRRLERQARINGTNNAIDYVWSDTEQDLVKVNKPFTLIKGGLSD